MDLYRIVTMKIGHHFGKRKPRWDFFTDKYQSLVDSSSNLIVKLLVASIVVQLIFFLPVLYWIFQNYNIIQSLVPVRLNIAENLEFEKKWIIFLVLTSVVMASCWNAFLWIYVYNRALRTAALTNDLTLSHDEVVDQRLAS